MTLFVVHYHFRPGGVRRVIELALPALAATLLANGGRVVLVSGEAPDEHWRRTLEGALAGRGVEWLGEPQLGYWVESKRPGRAAAGKAWKRVFEKRAGAGDVVWAHNQSLGRNLPATAELVDACLRRGLRLVLHHHDWWSDQRWHRWSEIRSAGFRSIASVARTLFPATDLVRHATINNADRLRLSRNNGVPAAWIPNPAAPPCEVDVRAVAGARRWLRTRHGVAGPFWLMPCRLLRRKNVAEALLLTRLLRPGAILVTTGGTSSAAEEPYAARLREAASRNGWPLRLSVLAGTGREAPSVDSLSAASEVLLLTSLQEGFGLPFIEAAGARRPLLARRLPEIAPDLARLGFRFPQSYDDLLMPDHLFDVAAERRRQKLAWKTWRASLPGALRAAAPQPPWWEEAGRNKVWPFSRLSLDAQLEVLELDPGTAWAALLAVNPWLAQWRRRAGEGRLIPGAWPDCAATQLGGEAYAAGVLRLLRGRGRSEAPPAERALGIQDRLLRAHLSPERQYPLLWNPES